MKDGVTWAEVEASWDDPSVHDAFLEACRRNDDIRLAAECYRQRLSAQPDDPVALKRQKQVVALAMMSIDFENARRHTMKDDESGRRGYGIPIFLAVIGAGLGGLGGVLLRPAAAAGAESACGGALEGSILCMFQGSALAVPLALVGGVVGLMVGFMIRRPRGDA